MEVVATTIKQEKEIKDIQIGKEETNLSLFTDDMILYIENYRLHQNTTEPNIQIWQSSRIQSQYSEIEGIFVHQEWNIGNRHQEKSPNWYSNKENKEPRNNVTKEVKYLYSENYTTLKKDINKWGIYHLHG